MARLSGKKVTVYKIFIFMEFYIHGSVYRHSILIRSNKMKQYAGVYLLQNHCTCFGRPSHPLSGVHKTITAASGTGHIAYQATTFLISHAGGRSLPDT